MMTEEHIKEAISLRYIELIAAYNGYKTSSSYPDYGTDLSIIEVGYRIENDRKKYLDTGRELKFQLKATTVSSIIEENSTIKYDLDAKTFNEDIEELVSIVIEDRQILSLHIENEDIKNAKPSIPFFDSLIHKLKELNREKVNNLSAFSKTVREKMKEKSQYKMIELREFKPLSK